MKKTLAANYSGKGPARVVLFSPIANEKHPDPDLPLPVNNTNILAYASAMREVAAANGVPFVDLYHPSLDFYAAAHARGEALTVNGIHLTSQGDRLIGEAICSQLFPGQAPSANFVSSEGASSLEKLRAAINEKNAQWHQRYRTIDGNNIYGGRSALAYEPGKGGFTYDREAAAPRISNFEVMQEEMSQRDVLTANRDRRIWAIAKGADLEVDDSNLPAVEKVPSNLPGPNPDKTFPFLSGEEAITKMKTPAGLKVNLFASEEQFPELIKPVQMAWDTRGRLWVAAWPNYPERTPTSKEGDSLLILEDTNGDGRADKCTRFIGDLNGPTGFQFYKDGVLLVQAPDVWFVRDTDGDNHADSIERILMGLSSADSHHTANSLCLDPMGAVYLSDGIFHRTQVETPYGPVRNNDAAIYRYEPRTERFETYVAYNFANPHGRVFDYWGDDLITDATGNNTYFAPAFSGHLDYPAKHPTMHEFWKRPSRPCPGTAILTSRHFPAEYQGNFLDCNVISFQGIYRVQVSEDGSGLKGETLEPLVSSSDPNFRPVAVDVGPDGAVYFADWQNPIIGHMQHHLRDSNRDHKHGRIYRITCEGRPLDQRPVIAGQPVPALLEFLKRPENQIREWAKVELGKHPAAEVIPAVRAWVASLDSHDPDYQHDLLEALWTQAWQNVLDGNLLRRMLRSPEPRARAAATRVLCYMRDRVPDALPLLKTLAEDPSPRVRLQAVRAASFFTNAEAVDVAFTALRLPTDYYLDYTLRETLRQLEPWWRKEIETGSPLAQEWSLPKYQHAREFLFGSMSTAELLALPRHPMVLETLLTRPELSDSDRVSALASLAASRKQTSLDLLIEEFDRAAAGSDKSDAAASSLSRLLPYQNPAALQTNRDAIVRLTRAPQREVRRNAWAALAAADANFDRVWRAASVSPDTLPDLLSGVPLILDPAVRDKAFPLVAPILASANEQSNALLDAAISAVVSMNSHQPEAFAALARLLAGGSRVPEAARSLRIIPRSK
ncbi:MAG TPA: PVC-type heme-binding CxxCH protein, partial [Verrucomicrobiae bacterium]|nr:PVC-type heme-binding CxxCH protein [Verrucomicrobiae bacterium]